MMRDLFLYLLLGIAIGTAIALWMIDSEDFRYIGNMSSDYREVLKRVGWLIK